MKTVIGVFDDPREAKSTLPALARLGLDSRQIALLCPVQAATSGMCVFELEGLGRVAANGPMLDLLNKPGGIAGALVDVGVPEGEVAPCIDSLQHGATLEAVTVEDAKEAEALEILRHGPASPKAEMKVESSPPAGRARRERH